MTHCNTIRTFRYEQEQGAGQNLEEGTAAGVEAQLLRSYLTVGAVHCSQRLLDAT